MSPNRIIVVLLYSRSCSTRVLYMGILGGTDGWCLKAGGGGNAVEQSVPHSRNQSAFGPPSEQS